MPPDARWLPPRLHVQTRGIKPAAANAWLLPSLAAGVIHIADMTGLLPGQTYSYRVGDASGGWSEPYNFTAFPDNLGTADRPFR